MSNPLLQAYLEVEMAMERFTLVLHDHVDQNEREKIGRAHV